MAVVHLAGVDWAIVALYFAFVLGIGWLVHDATHTTTDFFLSGRAMPAWVAGLAFLSANLGAQEVIGMAASGAKYGIATSHFYWIGAVPAMVFAGLFMIPFYYGSRARSVPEYLRLRFDEKTRAFNAVSFAVMTLFSSGISMYAMGRLLETLVGWNFDDSIAVSAAVVLAYVLAGGLTSAIYNEVLQFFLIVLGFAPLVLIGLADVGGWTALGQALEKTAVTRGYPAGAWTHSWTYLGRPDTNPMGVDWFGMVAGLGFVLSFGYWCTDFLVIQRAMAARSMSAARRTPLIAAVPKMLFPALVILPGMIAMALTEGGGKSGFALPRRADATFDYDLAIPLMLAHYFPPGMLGLGLTALLASFMSGMAGNVTAFNTVSTFDLYQAHVRPGAPDAHYVRVGRIATVAGVLGSVATAYLALRFNDIMDLLQLVFAFINAPLFATFLLGMAWRRTTGDGAFWGLVAGTLAAAIHHGLTIPAGATTLAKGGWLVAAPLHVYASEMAQNFWTAIWAWTTCFVATIGISLATRPTRTDAELAGLVLALTRFPPAAGPWWHRPAPVAAAVVGAAIALDVAFR